MTVFFVFVCLCVCATVWPIGGTSSGPVGRFGLVWFRTDRTGREFNERDSPARRMDKDGKEEGRHSISKEGGGDMFLCFLFFAVRNDSSGDDRRSSWEGAERASRLLADAQLFDAKLACSYGTELCCFFSSASSFAFVC